MEKAEKAEEERKKKNKITSSALIICQTCGSPRGGARTGSKVGSAGKGVGAQLPNPAPPDKECCDMLPNSASKQLHDTIWRSAHFRG